MEYSPKGRLHVGWADGRVAADLNPRRKRGRIKRLKSTGPIMAVSPNGRLAVMQFTGSNSGQVIRIRDRMPVVELHQMRRLSHAKFSKDGKKLFIAEQNGKIHVWRKAQDLEKLLSKRTKIQDYVARQNANSIMNFGLPAFILLDHDKDLAFGTDKGKLYYWDAAKPTEADIVMHLVPPIQSMTRQKDTLFGTSSDGHMRGYSFKKDAMIPWTKNTRAERVATGSRNTKHVATVGDKTLSWLSSSTGKVVWKKDIAKLGDGTCGLSVDPKGKYIALCVNQVIYIHRTKDGKRTRLIRRKNKKLVWK